jgi:hypothetical protein
MAEVAPIANRTMGAAKCTRRSNIGDPPSISEFRFGCLGRLELNAARMGLLGSATFKSN